MASPECSAEKLANLISHDVALASAVLQVVNSSDQGLDRSVSDLKLAVDEIGFEQIKTVVSKIKLKQSYETASNIKLERFWDETVETGNMMLFINQWLGNRCNANALYTMGLFHDCGIAAMASKFEDYLKVVKRANAKPELNLLDLENEIYDTDHATVGYFVTSSWHLPKAICNMIRYHHDLDFIRENFRLKEQSSLAILHIAENVLRNTNRFEASAWFQNALPEFLEWLNLSEQEYHDLLEDYEDSLSQ